MTMEMDLLIIRRRNGYNLVARSERGIKWIKDNIVTLNPETVFLNCDKSDIEDFLNKAINNDLEVEVI